MRVCCLEEFGAAGVDGLEGFRTVEALEGVGVYDSDDLRPLGEIPILVYAGLGEENLAV
ncbi:MAG: hypothetical protein MJZ04_07195 [Bacteroidales bacterium]|nr:hypothetical protein [Bacteroidales bacterium]